MAQDITKLFNDLGNAVDTEGNVSNGAGATWSAGVAFKRSNPLPIDKYSVFKTYDEALLYAQLNPVAYPGQIVVVVEDGSSVAYAICNTTVDDTTTTTLQRIGSVPSGDDQSIVIDDNDNIKIHSYGEVYYAYNSETQTYNRQVVDSTHPWKAGLQPRVANVDGELVIEWYEPNPTTVEGLEARLTAAEGDIDALETVTAEHTIALANVYTKDETYNKTEIDSKVAGAFHFKGEAKLELDEQGEWTGRLLNKTTDEVIIGSEGDVYQVEVTKGRKTLDKEFAWDGSKWVELGFTIDLSEYAKSDDVAEADALLQAEIDTKADDDEYQETKTIVTKLDGAETVDGSVKKQIATAKSEVESVAQGYADTAEQNAKDYADDNFVKSEEGKRLITDAEGTKLAGIEEGAEVNFIKSASNEFTVTNGNLEVNSIASSKVSGLGSIASLNEISESNLSETLATKLNNKADSATTLGGYGITDAMTSSEITSAIATAKSEAISTADSNADTKISAKVGDITGTVKAYVDGAILSISTDVSELSDRVDDAETAISALGTRVDTAETNITNNTQQIALLVSNTESIDGRVSAIENDYLTSTDKTALQNQITTNATAISTETQRAESAESELRTAIASKVDSVTAEDNSITIGGTATAPTVSVKIANTTGNLIDVTSGGLQVIAPSAVEYSIVKDTDSGDYAAVYHLTKDGVNTGTAINIPKDMVVQSGEVVKDPAGKPAGTYIKLVLQNVTEPLYINVSDLIEYVTSGSQTGDMVVIAIDEQHKVTATITDGTVTKAKLENSVQVSLGLADTAVQPSAIVDMLTKTEAATTYVAKETGKSLIDDTLITKLEAIETGAEVNVIETVKVNGTALTVTDKAVNIPVATGTVLGVVLSSTANDKVAVGADGSMTVNSLNANKLYQTENDWLTLNGGDATETWQ